MLSKFLYTEFDNKQMKNSLQLGQDLSPLKPIFHLILRKGNFDLFVSSNNGIS